MGHVPRNAVLRTPTQLRALLSDSPFEARVREQADLVVLRSGHRPFTAGVGVATGHRPVENRTH